MQLGWSWGFPSSPQRRGKETFGRSKFILLFSHPSYLSTLSNRYWILLFQSGIPFWPPFFSSRVYGHCSKLACWGRRLKSWRREHMSCRQRGGGKWGKWWQDQRQKVSMGSWRESCHNPTLPHPNLPLRSLILPPVPPSPSHLFKSPQDLKPQILQVRPLCLPLQLLLQLQRRTYQPTCNPLGFKWGAQSMYIHARLRVAKRTHQPLGLPLVPM